VFVNAGCIYVNSLNMFMGVNAQYGVTRGLWFVRGNTELLPDKNQMKQSLLLLNG